MDRGTGSLTDQSFGYRVARFAEEMGRRRVWRSALAYGAVVFVLLQLGEIVLPAFQAPDWAMKVLVVTSLLGFPVALALAWVFDITSHGIRITRSPEGGEAASYGKAIPRLALLAVTLSCMGGIGWWTVRGSILTPAVAAGGANPGSLIPASLDEDARVVRSLAVLPLDDFSEDEGGAYFTAGLHEELVSQISRLTSARVVSRTSVVQFDRSGMAMPAIARELGVDAVVEGSVFRSGERVRITVQLIHGPSDTHLWADSYEGTTGDAISFQREVAESIARAIQAEISLEDPAPSGGMKAAAKSEAVNEYMKGRYEQAKGTPEGLASAIRYYETAVEEDSSYAPAFAGLASARILLAMQSGEADSPGELVDGQVVQALEMAFRLDEDSPEAQAVVFTVGEALGDSILVQLKGKGTIPGDSVWALGPEVAREATEFGRQLHRVVLETNRSLELGMDPAVGIAGARRLAAASHHREAEAALREVIETTPDAAEAWDALEQLRIVQGDFEGVLQAREERMALSETDAETLSAIQDLEKRLSEEGEAGYWSWRLAELQGRTEEGETVSDVEVARALVGVGRYEEAFPHLNAAVEMRDRGLLTLWTDPGWDILRDDVRFKGILRELRSLGSSNRIPWPEWPLP